MKKMYEICVQGCDDSTKFEMELTEEEFLLIEKVAAKCTKTSEYVCQPTMDITEAKE